MDQLHEIHECTPRSTEFMDYLEGCSTNSRLVEFIKITHHYYYLHKNDMF